MPTDARDVLRAAAILTGDRDYELLIEKPLRGPENVDAVIQRRLAVFLELTIPLQPVSYTHLTLPTTPYV